MTVESFQPTAGRADLLDVTVRLQCEDALPGVERAWNLVRDGRLDRTGMRHGLSAEDRVAWLPVALKVAGGPQTPQLPEPTDIPTWHNSNQIGEHLSEATDPEVTDPEAARPATVFDHLVEIFRDSGVDLVLR